MFKLQRRTPTPRKGAETAAGFATLPGVHSWELVSAVPTIGPMENFGARAELRNTLQATFR